MEKDCAYYLAWRSLFAEIRSLQEHIPTRLLATVCSSTSVWRAEPEGTRPYRRPDTSGLLHRPHIPPTHASSEWAADRQVARTNTCGTSVFWGWIPRLWCTGTAPRGRVAPATSAPHRQSRSILTWSWSGLFARRRKAVSCRDTPEWSPGCSYSWGEFLGPAMAWNGRWCRSKWPWLF